MLKEAIAKGDTVELAFANACQELGVDTSEAECEILEMPTKKTLGLFGGSPAKVRAFIEENNPAQEAADYLKSVLKEMGLPNVTVEIQEEEAGAALMLNDEDIGFIIGHRGETLDALQYLASLVANHVDDTYFRITLDVGNYREKRKETLESLGKKMAERAVKTGRNSSLEPMNPYERRIIHTAVQDIEGAKSWSEGEDLARHVVIGPEGGERVQRRDNRRGDNRRGGNRGGYHNRDNRDGRDHRGPRPPRSQSAPTGRPARPMDASRQMDAPRTDDPSAPIYGKIEAKK